MDGRVLDYTTWLPVENAIVRLEPGGHQTTTDAEGEYEFLTADVPPGEYTIITAHEDCSNTQGPYLVDGQGLSLDLFLFGPWCDSGVRR
ncbi:carboxypeptidase-like regulatory domain-containing protein [Actinoplanes sp. TRM 88003]|uniref:Carboxypeptidase-like regulatory domain-containing protein n=1 Tax=Paractinoplanes aksuensis TaxID=2939490 RepID=A0ABT1DF20_9ACTN|nr:carboxypeptidase-like regulatory domain-containing protein [Actinoplanes aksuensis]MCO8269416.1 carboxypeptidase-like regulatory domain-containing protein [Actinoplanes aksuensis]